MTSTGLGLFVIKIRRKKASAASNAWDSSIFPLHSKQDDTGEINIDPGEIEICKLEDGSYWVLGGGGFGTVYKGVRRGVQEVAVKKLACDTAAVLWLKRLAKETSILKKVSHDRNVVQFYGAYLKDQASGMLVMEYMAVRLCGALPL